MNSRPLKPSAGLFSRRVEAHRTVECAPFFARCGFAGEPL